MGDALEEAKARGAAGRPKFAGMAAAIEALKQHDAIMQAVFWLSPNLALENRRPVDLVETEPLAVIRAARMFGEQGCV